MTFLQNLNWLAIFVASLAYFMLGALWYSALFQKKWVEYQQIDMSDPNLKKGTGAIMTGSFVWMFLATLALAIIVNRLNLDNVVSGLKWGFFTGFFFSASSISITYLYIKRPFGLHLIDCSYHIVGQMMAAVILCLWR